MKLQIHHLPMVIALLVVAMVLSSCQTPTTQIDVPAGIQPPPVGPLKVKRKMLAWDGKHKDAEKWTEHLYQVLPTLGEKMLDVLPADYKTFCPKYKELDETQRVDFYAHLISIMARYESNFKPATSYAESGHLAGVISRGLLQISISSSNSYKCGFKVASELHDPLKNLSCGVRILNRWIGERDKVLAGQREGKWQGGARYWAVMRDIKGKKSYAGIKSYMNNLSICK